jgi:hypothetical protein
MAARWRTKSPGLRHAANVVNWNPSGGAVAQLGARLDGIEEVVGSNPIGSTNFILVQSDNKILRGHYGFSPVPFSSLKSQIAPQKSFVSI